MLGNRIFNLRKVRYKRDWFRNISDKQGKVWLGIALFSIIYMFAVLISAGAMEGDPTKFEGGLHWQSFAYALWESIYCIGISIGLITLFRRKLNTQGKAAKTASPNAYTMYLIPRSGTCWCFSASCWNSYLFFIEICNYFSCCCPTLLFN